MSKTTARIKLLRNVLFNGEAYAAGSIATVGLEDALACVEMQKATFVDDADRERALEARRADIARMLRVTTPWHQAGPSGAWQRTH